MRKRQRQTHRRDHHKHLEWGDAEGDRGGPRGEGANGLDGGAEGFIERVHQLAIDQLLKERTRREEEADISDGHGEALEELHDGAGDARHVERDNGLRVRAVHPVPHHPNQHVQRCLASLASIECGAELFRLLHRALDRQNHRHAFKHEDGDAEEDWQRLPPRNVDVAEALNKKVFVAYGGEHEPVDDGHHHRKCHGDDGGALVRDDRDRVGDLHEHAES
mmetsp:Transcript_13424/g.31975  ORF Transcript_13424/g.31975 Transcript_13424/m.31975 type:complete len:220 (-) Transcript_13424:738-1397(-)